MKTKNIGFIGAGNMATSLIRGLVESGLAPANIWITDINPEAQQALANTLHVNIAASNAALVQEVDVVVLAVKPQVMRDVAQQVAADVVQKKVLVVSIAAGITQGSLLSWLGDEVALVRCMPNTPALVLTGATALYANANVNAEQKDLAENILRAVGISLWVENESELDAVTAVSGSGPAYYFLMMEAMEKAALELGLNAQHARLLILQTALGAAKIAMESSETPEVLRKRVTSPGGTTQAAIQSFEQSGFTPMVIQALRAAHDRSVAMSKELGAI